VYKKNFFQSQRLITKYGDCLLCSTTSTSTEKKTVTKFFIGWFISTGLLV